MQRQSVSSFVRLVLSLALMVVVCGGPGAGRSSAQSQKAEVVAQVGHSYVFDYASAELAFSPDSRQVLTVYNREVKLWDVKSGRLVRSIEDYTSFDTQVGSSVGPAGFLKDGRFWVLSCVFAEGCQINLHDVSDGRLIKSMPASSDMDSATTSTDGALLISSGENGLVSVWSIATGDPVARVTTGLPSLSHRSLASSGGYLFGAVEGKIFAWQLHSGALVGSTSLEGATVTNLVAHPGGYMVLARSSTGALFKWQPGGAPKNLLQGPSGDLFIGLTISADGSHLAATVIDDRAVTSEVNVWRLDESSLVAVFHQTVTGKDFFHTDSDIALSKDGSILATGGSHSAILTWQVATGRQQRLDGGGVGVGQTAVTSEGSLYAWGIGPTAMTWDSASGRLQRLLRAHEERITAVALSSRVSRIAVGDYDGTITIHDMNGEPIQTIHGEGGLKTVHFSTDGRFLLGTFTGDKDVQSDPVGIWDVATGEEVPRPRIGAGFVNAVSLSPDGMHVLIAVDGSAEPDPAIPTDAFAAGATFLYLIDTRTWTIADSVTLRSTDSRDVRFSPDGRSIFLITDKGYEQMSATRPLARANRRLLWTHDLKRLDAAAIAPRGDGIAVYREETGELRYLDAATGVTRNLVTGKLGDDVHFTFEPKGPYVLVSSLDGAVRRWDPQTGRFPGSFHASSDGAWAVLTTDGFLAGRGDDVPVHIVRGTTVTMLDQVFRSLYNPDLVREALAGDPNGEVAAAAKVLNLDAVLDSGPAPEVEILSPGPASSSKQDLVEVSARITDLGKGVGRIEWRVNGVTAAVKPAPSSPAPDHLERATLALDAGENLIEVVAYNGSSLLASPPARANVKYTGPVDRTKPRLHVLSIGINTYSDPGVAGYPGFQPLKLAAVDAEAVAAALKRAGGTDIYAGAPNVVPLSDGAATRDGITAAVERMAKDIHPRDTFILFAAGHGISKDGRFYLIPQDYKGGTHRKMLASRAIGQDLLQDWLANKIKAKRALVLLDTCESGALVSGHLRARSEAAASEAGIGRLHEATGRPVLTASAMDQAAIGRPIPGTSEMHGVFTWAVLDALRKGDRDNDGKIALSELAAHVQSAVPKVSDAKAGAGASATPAFEVTEVRGAGIDFSSANEKRAQSARFGSRGEDFAISRTLAR